MAASCIVAFFSALSAASFGANHKVGELLSMLSACRSVYRHPLRNKETLHSDIDFFLVSE